MRFRAALAALALSSSVFGADWKNPTAAEKAIVDDAAKGYSGAVYLEKRMESKEGFFTTTVRAKILSRTGFGVGTIDDVLEDATEIEGRTVSPGGLVTLLPKSDIRTIATVKAAGATVKRKGFTLPALEPGCFIEFTYREPGIFGSHGLYQADVSFQDEYSILRQELITSSQIAYSSAVRFAHGVTVRFEKPPGHYLFVAENIPALHPEPYGLPRSERSAGVIFSYFFQDLRATSSEQYWEGATRLGLVPWVQRYVPRPGKVRDRLRNLPGSRTVDAKARLRAIYEDVRDGFENRDALAAGERPPKGGWKTNSDGADVVSHRSGHATELASVLLGILKEDGWKARALFCADAQARVFHHENPSIFQFDTWLVEVRDPGLSAPAYLSLANPMLPFGDVPWNYRDVDAYAVDLETSKGEIVHVPPAPADHNREHREWTISVSPEGDLRVERESRWTGLQAFDLRARLRREGVADYENSVRERLRKLDPPGTLDSLKVEALTSQEAELAIRSVVRRPSFAATMPGGRMALTPLALMESTNPFTQEKRTDPIRFPYPYRDENRFTITAPPGYVVDGWSGTTSKKNEIGRYAVDARKGESGSVVIDRNFELQRAAGRADEYVFFRELFEAAAKGDADFAVLFRKAGR